MPSRRRRGVDAESRRIDWLRDLVEASRSSAVRLGIGDDAALWKARPGHEVVLSVDALAEGTHFRRVWLSPREIGRRAVSAAASDLAAMAAKPAGILLSLLIPEDFSDANFRALLRGVDETARDYELALIGGNTSRGPLSVTVTVLGEVETGRALRRDALRAGDEVWVTGCPGLARLGLRVLESSRPHAHGSKLERRAVAAFKRPRARIAESHALAKSFAARAAIDLSDGLASDLGHLIDESKRAGRDVGIEIDAEAIANREPLASICEAQGLDAAETALAGGDDYELCFTAPKGRGTTARKRAFERRFGVEVTRIGRVIASEGVWLVSGEERRQVERGGFAHF
jgi:thiamine-monophosphate kinase